MKIRPRIVASEHKYPVCEGGKKDAKDKVSSNVYLPSFGAPRSNPPHDSPSHSRTADGEPDTRAERVTRKCDSSNLSARVGVQQNEAPIPRRQCDLPVVVDKLEVHDGR